MVISMLVNKLLLFSYYTSLGDFEGEITPTALPLLHVSEYQIMNYMVKIT